MAFSVTCIHVTWIVHPVFPRIPYTLFADPKPLDPVAPARSEGITVNLAVRLFLRLLPIRPIKSSALLCSPLKDVGLRVFRPIAKSKQVTNRSFACRIRAKPNLYNMIQLPSNIPRRCTSRVYVTEPAIV